MRLIEFASAQDQIALWRLVSDSVWASISLQAEQERKQRAEKAAQSKYKGTRGKKPSKIAKPPAPISSPITAPPTPSIANKTTLSKKPQPTAPTAPTNQQSAKMQQTVASAHTVKQPAAQPVQQFGRTVATTVQPTTPNTVQNPSSVSKPAANAQTTAVVAQPMDGTDRHSANGYRAQPVQPARTTARGAISR